jgi:hypothetical protein
MIMTEPIWLLLLLHIAPTVAALAAFIAAVNSHRAVQRIHLEINSRLSELLKAKAAESLAVGHAAGVEAERGRVKP